MTTFQKAASAPACEILLPVLFMICFVLQGLSPALAEGLAGGDFEGPPPGAPWQGVFAPALGGADLPGLGTFGGGADHEGRVGDNPATLAIGWEPSGIAQAFDCFDPETEEDPHCTVTFDGEHLGGTAGAGEQAKVALFHGGATVVGLIPGSALGEGGRHTLSLPFCSRATTVLFWIESQAPDPPGLTSRLFVDNVECECTEGDRSTLDKVDEDAPAWLDDRGTRWEDLAASGEPRGPEGFFSIEIGAGLAGIDSFENNRLALSLTPRISLRETTSLGIDLTFPIIFVPQDYPDPWLGQISFSDSALIDASDLEVGPSLTLAPSIELTFGPSRRTRPSVFLGTGFTREKGRSTELEGLGTFRTTDSTSPVLTFGAALAYDLSAKTALRLEGRVLTAFMDHMIVAAADHNVTLEGGSVTTGLVTVGLRFDLD